MSRLRGSDLGIFAHFKNLGELLRSKRARSVRSLARKPSGSSNAVDDFHYEAHLRVALLGDWRFASYETTSTENRMPLSANPGGTVGRK
ncbi:MAG TPA: hypothetical protein VFG04_30925 [Planctomycetaceae bacterium]|nr:hypothetical protein [Planctomycetaceae bacterium]